MLSTIAPTKTHRIIGAICLLLLILGFGVIVFLNRPVNQIPSANAETSPNQNNSYSIADITLHDSKEDCWTAINMNVYDISSFVYRHPGGVRNITRLCGIDGTELFTREHGRSKLAQASLGLLKIGTLSP